MDYKSLMGYKKKKLIKEQVKSQSKPKKNKVLEGVRKEINESRIALGIQTMKDTPVFQTEKQIKEVSAAPQYKKMYKDIVKAENQLAKSVDKMASFLNKQGLKNQSMMLKGNYIQDVRDFVDKFLKRFIKELL